MAIRRSARLRRAQDTPEVSNIATTPVVGQVSRNW
jgi:hypothetical protein